MNAQRLRAISDYNKVASTKTDTKDPHELIKLLFEGLTCLLYTSLSPRDGLLSRMPSSA